MRDDIRSDAERWERIQSLFHDAADLPEAQRRAFLERACGGERELVAEVLSLIEEDARGSLLDRDVAHVAGEMVGTPPSSEVPHADFAPYRIKTLIGEGGMGVVYLAERDDLASRVAIKVLRDAWLSPSRRERFASEQRTLAQLEHPSIARLYDADTLPDGTPWFAMEYVEGVPLTEYCLARRCSLWVRLQLFRSVCEAVQYAHSRAVIHRDLKPSNILVKNDGAIRLLDFGIAKSLETLDRPAGDVTRTGLRLMTPAYAAPEQIRGDRTDVATDVYSLGVILYELLAGRLPFDLSHRTPAEAETVIVEHEPERPSVAAGRVAEDRRGSRDAGAPGDAAAPREVRAASVGKAAWADLDVLCMTAMHKDPERRYRSVEALIRDVDHYLDSEPLEARADSVRYRLGKFVRRNQRSLATAAVVLSAVVGLVAFFTVRLAIARNEALAEAARTQRIQHFMTNLFQGGDEAAGPADSLRVVTLLDRGVQEAKGLSAEPELQAELYGTLGSIYQQLGRFDEADGLLRSALEARRGLYGADDERVAESLVALGLLRADQARYEDAERLVREGLDMDRRVLPARHPAIAKAMASLGLVRDGRGDYPGAIEVLEDAERLQSAPGAPTSDLSETLTELANAHFYAGHYDTSQELNQRVLDIDRRLYGERHPHVADDLINIGAIDFERGRYPSAERYYRRALEIFQAWYGKDHQETASAMTLVGRALIAEKRGAEAIDMLHRAIAVQEHVYGAVHPRVASALGELGQAALQQGRLDEAQADFERMRDIYVKVYGEQHQFVCVAMSNLGSVLMEKKQFTAAEALFREAALRLTASVGPEHLNTGIARLKLGRSLLAQKRYAEAEKESLAAYGIIAKQTEPSGSFLHAARKDLVAIYEGLHRPQEATRFRAEAEKADGKPADQAAAASNAQP